ncbi:CoA pyrophosphatase [Chitinibacter bivalviorum]|uniref:CoA pyrophosphatase n=1 Tax=Chitinibacter bivalviorum TaxID=2739434 RepID=A0A7H9BFW3_9NEIS|nr:CoA pyrophosphatase [Chitinibacter bivalviorum]QLG87509.1 CoA pyrophosphatase [Chitinibacter bivalviorum]
MLPTQPEALLAWLHQRLSGVEQIVAADVQTNAHRPAAVLIGLVLHPDEVTVLLTQRALHLSVHAGQVSFPGGALEESDADLVAAALRETEEEVGIPAHWIRPIATLGEYHTISGFCVTPVLASLSPGYPIKPDPNEVAEVFELPLSVLLDPNRYQKRWVERNGVRGTTHFLDYADRTVWGATAGMLLQLSHLLGLEGIPEDKTTES